MAGVIELRTPRLVLRGWRPADRAPFAALNADPEVMAHFPATLDRAESDAMVEVVELGLEARGWGLWAVEVVDTGGFVGFVGLNPVAFEAPFAPAVEVGWRLARDAWGRGYATEAATAALDLAFGPLGLDEVVSFTVPANARSRAVMTRLGMAHDTAGDFDHPRIPAGHPLRRHVLHRVDAATWAARRGAPRQGAPSARTSDAGARRR